MAQVQVRDKIGKAIPGINARLSLKDLNFDQIVDKAGNTDFTFAAIGMKQVLPGTEKFRLEVNTIEAFNSSWKSIEQKVLLVENFQNDIKVILDYSFSQPTKISVSNKTFLVNDKVWKYHSVTAFSAFKDFIDGKSLESFFNFAHECKANVLRTFSMWSVIDFYPALIPNYFVLLDQFIRYCRENGFYVEFCIFASANEVMPAFSNQFSHYNNCCAVLKNHENILVSLVNENDLAVNNVQVEKFLPFEGLLYSSGSSGGDVDPPEPIRGYTEFHLGRNNEWPRKAKSAREFADKFNVPCINNETNRPDIDGYQISNFRECGLVSGLLTAGTNAHSEALKYCKVPTGQEAECVKAILHASNELDPSVYLGNYTRGGLHDCPMYHTDDIALRTFAIIIDNKAWAVIVQSKPDNPKKAAEGWKIVYEKDNYFELERI
jgi:hypothetical protein